MSLDALPTELLLQIHSLAGPASTLNLALVSTHFEKRLHDALRHHQHCSKRFRTYREENAHSIIGDSIAAWHVNDFCQILHFRELLRMGVVNQIEPQDIIDSVQGVAMTPDQRQQLREFCIVTENGESVAELSERARKFTNEESSHSLLVIALCSNISTWTIKRPYPATSMDDAVLRGPAAGGRASFNSPFLARVISAMHTFTPPIWLPGFASLRRITIGASSRPDPERVIARIGEVMPLFLLPSLETIYVRGLALDRIESADWRDEGPRSMLYRLLRDSSNVRNVCLDHTTGQSIKHIIDNIIEGCTGLETFIMRDCEISDFPDVITRMAEKHGSTLQTSFHCSKVQNLTGTKDKMFGRAHFRHLYGVKILAIVVDDGEHDMRRSIQDFVRPHSRTLEVLIVQTGDGYAFEQDQVQHIDEAFAHLLSSPNDEGDSLDEIKCCPLLKHIYLSPIIEAAPTLDEDENKQKTLLLPETIKHARLRGIEVHTERDAGKRLVQSMFGDIFKV